MRVFPGSTADPVAFTAIVKVVREKFALARMIMVGDRGMITSARIAALNQPEEDGAVPSPYGWIQVRFVGANRLASVGARIADVVAELGSQEPA